MSTMIIDGSIESADIRRTLTRHTVYKSVTFRQSDGSSRTIKRLMAAPALAAEIRPGAEGRFYIAQSLDQRMMSGIRFPDGRAVQGDVTALETLFIIMGGLNLALLVLFFLLEGEVRVLPTLIVVMSAAIVVMSRSARAAARAAFHRAEGGAPILRQPAGA